MIPSALLFLALPAFLGSSPVESGTGTVGEWMLVWRLDGGGSANRFRAELGDEVRFPIESRVVADPSGTRTLMFLGSDGEIEKRFPLEPAEDVLVSEDGSAWLTWSRDPVRRRLSAFRFFHRGETEPAWEASAFGEPIAFAPGGSLFVIATEDTTHDRFHRAWLDRGGRVQIVGASGDVRAELPLLPTYASLTGDARHVALLHNGELLVLRRDGTLAWNADIPVDHLLARQGLSQLQAAGGRIVVAGTGPPVDQGAWSMHPRRRGVIRVFTDEGRLLWGVEQPEDEGLWFQLAPCLSRDGNTLVTVHSDSGDLIVRLWDAETGERFWTRREPRQLGLRGISVTPDGQLVALSHGDNHTRVKAWDREGVLVWDGVLPLSSRTPTLAPGGLLVAESWIIVLTLAVDEI